MEPDEIRSPKSEGRSPNALCPLFADRSERSPYLCPSEPIRGWTESLRRGTSPKCDVWTGAMRAQASHRFDLIYFKDHNDGTYYHFSIFDASVFITFFEWVIKCTISHLWPLLTYDPSNKNRLVIIPVILPGLDKIPEMPAFLRSFRYVDFRSHGLNDTKEMRRLVFGLLSKGELSGWYA